MRYLERLVLIKTMFRHQLCEIGTIDSPSHIVPRRNRQEGTRIVIEPHGVVKTRCLCCLFAETHHAFRAVLEPPCWPKPQAWIVPRQRRKFAAVRRFIEREKDNRQLPFIAHSIEQWSQRVDEIDRPGNVRTHVAAKPLMNRPIMIPYTSRVNLHHEPIVHAHQCHLGQNRARKSSLSLPSAFPEATRQNSAAASASERSAVCAVGCP